jgi:stage II sporulation protein D
MGYKKILRKTKFTAHFRSAWVRTVALAGLLFLLALTVVLLIDVNSTFFKGSANCSFANACKVLAYLTGYSADEADEYDGYWFMDYYEYLCDNGVFEYDRNVASNPDKALMGSDVAYVCSFLGVDALYEGDRAVSNKNFIEFIQKYKEKFQMGGSLETVQLGIVATSGEADSNGSVFDKLYTVSTNKGYFYYTGLNLTGFRDKTIEALVIGTEILMVTDVLAEQTTFKNVWISGFTGNTLYVNMYGVNREFYIGGTSEDVSGMLADIVLENGKLVGITVKKDITDTNIRILLYNSSASSTVHENVVITSDTSFYAGYGDNITEYGAGEQLVFDSSFSGQNVVISTYGDGQIKLLSMTKSQGNPEYEGKLTVYGVQGGVVLVNELPIEDYLKRVVPSEMPASYGVEALKVQAVCARSYAYAHLESYAYADYEAHMDDTINFQVYNNTVEKDVVNQAISETCGKMLYYADQVVTAFYYSTSCGAGTDVSLWGSNTANYPYYVSRVISADNRELDLSVEANFRKFITQKNEKDYDYESSYYRWTVEKTSSEIAGNIKSMGYSDIGEISAVVVNKRVSGGGVNSVTIKGTKADVCLESEGQIRKAFDLPSSFFVVDTNNKTFTFTGGGYGHGIGMSQNAVRAMAAQGMDYISILNFFYVGTSVF